MNLCDSKLFGPLLNSLGQLTRLRVLSRFLRCHFFEIEGLAQFLPRKLFVEIQMVVVGPVPVHIAGCPNVVLVGQSYECIRAAPIAVLDHRERIVLVADIANDSGKGPLGECLFAGSG